MTFPESQHGSHFATFLSVFAFSRPLRPQECALGNPIKKCKGPASFSDGVRVWLQTLDKWNEIFVEQISIFLIFRDGAAYEIGLNSMKFLGQILVYFLELHLDKRLDWLWLTTNESVPMDSGMISTGSSFTTTLKEYIFLDENFRKVFSFCYDFGSLARWMC